MFKTVPTKSEDKCLKKMFVSLISTALIESKYYISESSCYLSPCSFFFHFSVVYVTVGTLLTTWNGLKDRQELMSHS